MGQTKKARKGDPKSLATARKIVRGGTNNESGKLSKTARKGNQNLPANPNAKKGKP